MSSQIDLMKKKVSSLVSGCLAGYYLWNVSVVKWFFFGSSNDENQLISKIFHYLNSNFCVTFFGS